MEEQRNKKTMIHIENKKQIGSCKSNMSVIALHANELSILNKRQKSSDLIFKKRKAKSDFMLSARNTFEIQRHK